MVEIFSRVGWIVAVAIAIAYMTYLIGGNMVSAKETRRNHPVVVRDELQPNVHHLSGMVMVSSPCDELSVKMHQISEYSYELSFSTWRAPDVMCTEGWTPRAFREILFAPASGINFFATLDNAAVPVAIVPIVQHAQ